LHYLLPFGSLFLVLSQGGERFFIEGTDAAGFCGERREKTGPGKKAGDKTEKAQSAGPGFLIRRKKAQPMPRPGVFHGKRVSLFIKDRFFYGLFYDMLKDRKKALFYRNIRRGRGAAMTGW